MKFRLKTFPACRSVAVAGQPVPRASARLPKPSRMLTVLPSAQGPTVLPAMPISNVAMPVSGNDVVGVAVRNRPADSGGLKLCRTSVDETLLGQIVNSASERGRLLEQARRQIP